MPKILSMTGIVVAILVFTLFLVDLLAPMIGMASLAPFSSASWSIDLFFAICAAVLGFMGWVTLREQR